jgi:Tfp pilus assembly protein PilO
MLVAIKEDLFFSLRHPRVRTSIIGFVLSALLALIIGMIYWWPVMHNVNRLRTEIDDRQREISSAEYNIKLAQTSGYAAQQMALIEKKLDTSVTQAVLVQNIATLARRNNVKIISEAYEEGKEKNGYAPLVHELTVQAGYAELRGFISGVQQLPTFTIVQEAILGRSSNSSVIKAQLNIITYRRAVEHQK